MLSRRRFLHTMGTITALSSISPALKPAYLSEASATGPLWMPDLHAPDLVVTAFFQEEVAEGPVAVLKSKGLAPYEAVQPDEKRRPVRAFGTGGVLFAANAGSYLVMPYVKDSLRLFRWHLVITRAKLTGGPNEVCPLATVNFGNSAHNCHPRILLLKTPDGVNFETNWNSSASGRPRINKLLQSGYIADGETWNCALGYRRQGRLFGSLNGIAALSQNDLSGIVSPTVDMSGPSLIGFSRPSTIEWAFDCIIFGQGELTDELVGRLEGWAMHRIGRAADLPHGHPYRDKPPLTGHSEDLNLYRHDPERWAAMSTAAKSERAYGGAWKSSEHFTRVFIDDFRRNSLTDSAGSYPGLHVWYSPGWNNSVGADAAMLSVLQKPSLYTHNPDGKGAGARGGGVLTLSMKNQNGWKAPAIYSVDDSGRGLSWEGEAIFRIRMKALKLEVVPGGYFPAFWSYGLEHLFYRHVERLELDFMEFDGKNPYWLNGGSQHVHAGGLRGRLGHLKKDAKRLKIFSGEVRALEFPKPMDFTLWDGQWHTWEFRIDENDTSISVTADFGKGDEWFQIVTVPTLPEFLRRKYLIVNYAVRKKDGEPDSTRSHDLMIDYIEVLQKLPSESNRKPIISFAGSAPQTGEDLQASAPFATAVSDIWWIWFVDGYLVQYSTNPVYRLREEDRGGTVRLMARLASAPSQPEVWSEATPAVQ